MWVFAYGSLLWNPGFDPVDKRLARVHGYARSFCMRSIHHRGSEEEPGLVLALDKDDGWCDGLALKVAEVEEAHVLEMLRERELVSSAYYEDWITAETDEGPLETLTYIVRRDHWQYCGSLPLSEQAQIIAHAKGGRGPNSEYLFATTDHLDELGIADADLAQLAVDVRAILAA